MAPPLWLLTLEPPQPLASQARLASSLRTGKKLRAATGCVATGCAAVTGCVATGCAAATGGVGTGGAAVTAWVTCGSGPDAPPAVSSATLLSVP